jgi:phenylpropionate dioxygenase-like ring-hydroxylating dioxygenase large terminal subunit
MSAKDSACETPWLGLFERLIDKIGTRRGDPMPGQPRTNRLPSSVYTDPVRYEAELTRLFRRMPLCLGPVDQFGEGGNVITREITGLALLITRDPAGRIRVFLNACRHRGARVLTDDSWPCRRTSLSCLYHGWTYGLDGRLLSIPRRDAFPCLDVEAHALRELPTTVRHGLIWVVLDRTIKDPPDVAAYLGSVDMDMSALRVGEHHFFRQTSVLRKANWKLIMDAFVEFYHIKRLHASTIGPFFADSQSVADYVGPHQRMLVAREGFADVLNLPPKQWDPQVHGTFEHLIFPNSLIVYHPDYISHMAVFPAGIDQSLFIHTVSTPELPQDDKARAHWDRSFKLIDEKVFNNEDLFICEQIQLALAASAGETFPLGRLEENLLRFHTTNDELLPATGG